MNSGKMKAIVASGYGGAEVLNLHEVVRPKPQINEVLIKIYATPVTTAETMMRTGLPFIGRFFTGLMKPKNEIPGVCFAGQIVEVGAAVNNYKIGDNVFGESIDIFGTQAEYLSIDENSIMTLKPENVSFQEASVACDGFVTSLNFLKNLADIKQGQNVLVIGASGSLGSAAVQLAKNFGAHVTGICSTKNIDLLKSIGADEVIDYTKENFLKKALSFDVVYDTIGISSFSKCKHVLKTNGLYISPVLNFGLLLRMITTSFIGSKKAKFSATGLLPKEQTKELLNEIKNLMQERKIKPVISNRYALVDVPAIHRIIDKGHKVGNLVIELD